MDYDQLPTMNELVGPAIGGLTSELTEPQRSQVANNAIVGRYGDVIRGWKAQCELVRRRLMSEIKAARLGFATDKELHQLALSEYLVTELPSETSLAMGEVVFQRKLTNTSSASAGNFKRGVIKSGHRFKRAAAPSAAIPVNEAQYAAAQALVVGDTEDAAPVDQHDGTWLHTQTIRVPIVASSVGEKANHPIWAKPINADYLPPAPVAVDRLFDTSFTGLATNGMTAAGGSSSFKDEDIERLMGATAIGTQGPNNAAALAGALYYPGVRHVAAGLEPTSGLLRLYAADASWASSPAFSQAILQYLKDFPWLGFGARAQLLPVNVYTITLQAGVVLRSRDYISDTTEITETIRTALLSYFNDRPDWWTWRKNAIEGTIVACDRRILDCGDVTIHQFGGSSTVSEPTDQPGLVTALNHWQLVADGLDLTFSTPGAA